MNKYYFLLSSLPVISIGTKPDISFIELKNYLDWNLSNKDKEKLFVFKQHIDLKNLKNIWLGKKIDPRGNLDDKTLNEAILVGEFFPKYVFKYLRKDLSVGEKLANFPVLESEFFRFQIDNSKSDFLLSYFTFQRNSRLIFAALRAKRLKWDISEELEGEDRKDFLVEGILSQKDEIDYQPPKEYLQLKDIFVKYGSEPKVLYRKFLEYCFSLYEDLSGKNFFTVDQILAYLANLILVEDYYHLNQDKGNSIVDSLL